MRRSETLMEAKMGANFLALFNLQTYTTFFPFRNCQHPTNPIGGVFGALRHEKTHIVGDVGLVVL